MKRKTKGNSQCLFSDNAMTMAFAKHRDCDIAIRYKCQALPPAFLAVIIFLHIFLHESANLRVDIMDRPERPENPESYSMERTDDSWV